MTAGSQTPRRGAGLPGSGHSRSPSPHARGHVLPDTAGMALSPCHCLPGPSPHHLPHWAARWGPLGQPDDRQREEAPHRTKEMHNRPRTLMALYLRVIGRLPGPLVQADDP